MSWGSNYWYLQSEARHFQIYLWLEGRKVLEKECTALCDDGVCCDVQNVNFQQSFVHERARVDDYDYGDDPNVQVVT